MDFETSFTVSDYLLAIRKSNLFVSNKSSQEKLENDFETVFRN